MFSNAPASQTIAPLASAAAPSACTGPTPALQIVRGIGRPKGPSERAKEAKRARRSEIERLSRLRRTGQYGSMQAEVARLEKLHAVLLEQSTVAGSTANGNLVQWREEYLKAVNVVRRLREEHARLKDMLHEKWLLSTSLRDLMQSFAVVEEDAREQLLATWFNPISMADAIPIMKESCEIAATFDQGGPWQSSGSVFMGWRDMRKLNEGTSTMIHRFTKFFPGRDAQEVMEKSWEMFCQEWFLQKTVVNSSTKLNMDVLQELGDSIRVIKRRTQYLAIPHKSFHTVYVLFRIQTEDGFAIYLKSINAPEYRQSLTEHESWVDVYHCINFSRSKKGCEVTFGGTMNSGVLSFAQHWLIESVLAVVRWETVCVAPLFILPQESSSDDNQAHMVCE